MPQTIIRATPYGGASKDYVDQHGGGGGVTEERVHEIVAEDTEDLVTEQELEEAISHATGKIELAIENMTAPDPTLNRWYGLILGEYSLADFQEHKFVLTLNGMVMEEVGMDYLDRMHIRPAEMPGSDGVAEATFAFMGGDRVFIIVFYRNGKGTLAPYGILQPSAAYAVGNANSVVQGYYDYDENLSKQVGAAVLTGTVGLSQLVDNTGANVLDVTAVTVNDSSVELGYGFGDFTEYDGGQHNDVSGSAEFSVVKGEESPITSYVIMGVQASGTKESHTINCNGYIGVFGGVVEEEQEGPREPITIYTNNARAEIKAPTIELKAAKLGKRIYDPHFDDAESELSPLLSGKYNFVIDNSAEKLSEASLSSIQSLLPFIQAAYPALMLFANGEALEIDATVDVQMGNISGRIANIKNHFSTSFSIEGQQIVHPNANTLFIKALLPYDVSGFIEDTRYVDLEDTCVWPGNSHKFTSDIANLGLSNFRIAYDFSTVRINLPSSGYDGTEEYTVIAKDLFLDVSTGIPYGARFYFFVPADGANAMHWAEINLGDL